MPTILFERSGLFKPSDYGLQAGDVVDVVAVGSGGGGARGTGSQSGQGGRSGCGGKVSTWTPGSYQNAGGGGGGGGYGGGGGGGGGADGSTGGGGGGSGYVVYGRYHITSSNVNSAVPVTVGSAVDSDQNGQISSFGSVVSAAGGSTGSKYTGGAGYSRGGNSRDTYATGGGGGAGGFYPGIPAIPNSSNGGDGSVGVYLKGGVGGGGGAYGTHGSPGDVLDIGDYDIPLAGAPNGGTRLSDGQDGGPGSGVVIVCWD